MARLDSREFELRVQQAEASLRQAEARLGISPDERFDPEKNPDVRQARAALERARYDWQAAQNLVDRGDISRQQSDVSQRAFEQAEARYQAALENVRNLLAVIEERRAALGLARKQLSDVIVKSPINGIVREKLASRGEYVQAGKPVAVLVRINPLRLRLEVPEAFAGSVKPGQRVAIRVDAFNEGEFEGRITRISPSLNERSRSLMVEADIPNAGGPLRPGMFARAQIVSDSEATVFLVPAASVLSIAGTSRLFVAENGRAVERPVRLGPGDGTMVEIIHGVSGGDRVITTNVDRLRDGVAVSTPAP